MSAPAGRGSRRGLPLPGQDDDGGSGPGGSCRVEPRPGEPVTGRSPGRHDLWPAAVVGVVVVGRLVAAPPVAQALSTGPAARAAIAVSGVVVVCALVVRRRAPRVVLAIVTAACVGWIVLGYPGPGAILPIAIALHAVALLTGPPRADRPAAGSTVLACLGSGMAVGAATWWLIARGGDPGQAIISALILALGGILGIAERRRRDLIAAQRRESDRREADRVEEVARAASEQRLAIARDLHDTIAHQLAVISVQAGAADQLLQRDPARARVSLAQVREAARAGTTELAAALEVLRQPVPAGSPQPTGAAPLTPQSTREPADLAALADAAGAAAAIDAEAFEALSSAGREVAYRVVQEGLTNAAKHAPGAGVTARVNHSPGWVVVAVANARPPARPAGPGPGAGRGLSGMTERVTQLGGRLTAGPTADGGWSVVAELPTRAAPPWSAATPPHTDENADAAERSRAIRDGDAQ